jgi:hypothetical protein
MYVQHLPRIGRSDHQCLLIVLKANEIYKIRQMKDINLIGLRFFFCPGVVYTGEYDVCDVTLSVYPHRIYTQSVYPPRI